MTLRDTFASHLATHSDDINDQATGSKMYPATQSLDHTNKESRYEKSTQNIRDDETRVHTHGTDTLHCNDGDADTLALRNLVDTAYDQLETGDYAAASKNIGKAMDFVVDDRQRVKNLVDHAINHFSALHGIAGSPHPATVKLIKKRSRAAL